MLMPACLRGISFLERAFSFLFFSFSNLTYVGAAAALIVHYFSASNERDVRSLEFIYSLCCRYARVAVVFVAILKHPSERAVVDTKADSNKSDSTSYA